MWKIFRLAQKGFFVRCDARPPLVGTATGDDHLKQCGRRVCTAADQVTYSQVLGFVQDGPLPEFSDWNFGTDDAKSSTDHDNWTEVVEPCLSDNWFNKCPSTSRGNDEFGGRSRSNEDGKETESECQRWIRSIRHGNHHPCHVLEAVGWGTALLSGLRMSHLFRSSKERNDETDSCWYKQLRCLATHLLKQRLLQIESCVSSTIKTVLPRGSFSSLRFVPTKEKDDDDGVTAATPVTKSNNVVFSFGEAFVKDIPILRNDTTENSTRDVSESSASADISDETGRTKTTQSASEFEKSSDDWLKMTVGLTARIENAEGVRLARRGDVESAVKLWQQAIADGAECVQAHFNLALAYERGLGVERDMQKAIEHYSIAVEKNHERSLYNLAMIFLSDKQKSGDHRRKIAMKLLKKSSELGLKEAQRELGVLYTELPNRDMARAVLLFEKAASQKDSKAIYFLGICYENAWGVDRSEKKAAALYQEAAAAGHPEAQYNLAVVYETGRDGLAQNLGKALELYRSADASGCVQAKQQTKRIQLVLQNEPNIGNEGPFTTSVQQSLPPPVTLSGWSRSFFSQSSTSGDSDAASSSEDSVSDSESFSNLSGDEFEPGPVPPSGDRRLTFGGGKGLRSGLFVGFSSDEDEDSYRSYESRRAVKSTRSRLV